MPMLTTGTRTPRQAAPKPANNIYTAMLVIAFAFVVLAVVFNFVDLVGRYQVPIGKALWPF